MDIDSVVASPSEVKQTIVQRIEEIDRDVLTLNAIKMVELAHQVSTFSFYIGIILLKFLLRLLLRF